jgi:integrase
MQRKPSSARRTRTTKSGIYYRIGRDGKRRYEITWLDPVTGRRRWQTVAGNLDAAEREMHDVRSRVNRGERIGISGLHLADCIEEWAETQRTRLRPKTLTKYEHDLASHILPRLGRLKLSAVTEDDIAAVIAEMSQGFRYVERDGRWVKEKRDKPYAAWTIRGVLVALSRVFAYAVRRGYVSGNPVSRLERGERPSVGRRERRVLSGDEITKLLDHSLPTYRPILATAVATGLRQSELLGLRWRDVDFAAGVIRVRCQLDRSGQYVEPKTPQAVRDVVLAPVLGRLLRVHRLASAASGDDHAVFANAAGRPLEHRNVQSRGFDKAAARAGINVITNGRRKATFHDLRHTFASLLIAQGADVVHVSRQLGHADPAITLRVYADEFGAVHHAERTRALLDAAVGNALETTGGEGLPQPLQVRQAETAYLNTVR